MVKNNNFNSVIPVRKMMESITPLKRMGTALDVAHLVDFLTNEKSTFLTGLSIPVDGGTRLLSQESIAKRFKSKK